MAIFGVEKNKNYTVIYDKCKQKNYSLYLMAYKYTCRRTKKEFCGCIEKQRV